MYSYWIGKPFNKHALGYRNMFTTFGKIRYGFDNTKQEWFGHVYIFGKWTTFVTVKLNKNTSIDLLKKKFIFKLKKMNAKIRNSNGRGFKKVILKYLNIEGVNHVYNSGQKNLRRQGTR